MTDAEIGALADFFRAIGYDTVKKILTYDALDKASKVLCRWPRPSELARVAGLIGNVIHKPGGAVTLPLNLSYYSASIPMKHDGDPKYMGYDKAAFVGTLGANMIKHTKSLGLLYMWLHEASKVPKANGILDGMLFAYATNLKTLQDALPEISEWASDHNLRVDEHKVHYKVLKMTSRAPDWAPS